MTQYNVTIKELPSEDRPRERLLLLGAGALTTAELLAILLRTGTKECSALKLADQLLRSFQDLRGVAEARPEDLAQVHGVGLIKAAQITAAVELGRRLAAHSRESRPVIRDPETAARLAETMITDPRREHFLALFLDSKNRLMKKVMISVGSLDTSVVHPREVFREAVSASAASMIVAHNHPSGDLSPSPEDLNITHRLIEAGNLIGIEVLDHIIIGEGKSISLKERQLM